ncbi:hypothetical protein QBC46DRAFT_448404 [Diplogelasinospora grovesii]|uniref:Protein kinase domain-containing protein n=1 Tax=Diplogelasinospora grovesii TaxID=303347 RepID=A0AAN6N9L7_9PEZI|nr:hypothetical protein QBC46DRAFT_448404 [Diplogelasinospora grovesii]
MESNRLWHDPVVEIFSNLITPGVRCSASAYDLANRRWYRLKVDDAEVVPDDDWLSSTVAKHVRATTARAGSPVTFETKPDDRVDRPITKSLSYGGSEPTTDKLPTTTFDQLESLTYISRSADRCTWHGKDCVFKRIEFDVDIEPIATEIRIRETLMDAIGPVGNSIADVNAEMTRRFLVVPVLAVVIGINSKPWKPGTVAGILMPFAGQDLEILARDNTDAALPITELQLRDLVRGVQELGKCGVEHGDIKYWNTVLQQPAEEDDDGAAAAAAAKLVLIDLGSVAPEYDGDAKALGTLLLWCLEHAAPTLRENEAARARVHAAAAALAEEDFDAALKSLSPGDA